MSKPAKPSPTESPLLFEVDPEPLPEVLTALGGVPLMVQAFRSLGLPALVKEHVQIKERQRGYDEATLVESFVILNAVGGECIDDFVRLREDAGLSEMVGHQMPSPPVTRKFLFAISARPKRLRFLIFNTPGRLVHHARRTVLRLATTAQRIIDWLEAARLLPVAV